MPSKDEILSKLSQLDSEVTRAREALLRGEVVGIENVLQRINDECTAITELEPEDAVDIKPQLDELLANFQTFSDEIAYVQNKVEEILAEQREQPSENDGSQSANSGKRK